jgi:hypothetical protein
VTGLTLAVVSTVPTNKLELPPLSAVNVTGCDLPGLRPAAVAGCNTSVPLLKALVVEPEPDPLVVQ